MAYNDELLLELLAPYKATRFPDRIRTAFNRGVTFRSYEVTPRELQTLIAPLMETDLDKPSQASGSHGIKIPTKMELYTLSETFCLFRISAEWYFLCYTLDVYGEIAICGRQDSVT